MEKIKHQTTKPQIGDMVCLLWVGWPAKIDTSCIGKVVKVGRTNVTIEGQTGKTVVASINEDSFFGFTSDLKGVEEFKAKAKKEYNLQG